MTKRKAFLWVAGMACSVLPPALATLNLFPLMTTAGKVSAVAVILLALSLIPLFKHVKRILASPSAWILWGILFALSAVTRAFIDEFYMIAMLGFVGSAVGAVFFRLARGKGGDT
ncbi:MAG: hypothetical protein J6W28_00380 [Clostridia bacterium]|nr:hypothetical protein [Clostridia bacterium]